MPLLFDDDRTTTLALRDDDIESHIYYVLHPAGKSDDGVNVRMSGIIVSSACATALLVHAWLHAADEPAQPGLVEVWVVLSEPALATLPREATEQRTALRRRIVLQQDAVMAQLAALGAIEAARVQQVRNTIAVRLPPAAIEEAKKIEGVVGVHAVSHRNRIGY